MFVPDVHDLYYILFVCFRPQEKEARIRATLLRDRTLKENRLYELTGEQLDYSILSCIENDFNERITQNKYKMHRV
jgi:hypothetical protein